MARPSAPTPSTSPKKPLSGTRRKPKKPAVRQEADQVAQLNSEIRRLRREMKARTTALEKAREHAEQGSRAKGEFLANMSHEIRTPLTAIIGYGESLLDSGMGMEERLAAIKTIIRSGKHLLSIINDLLDLTKLEANKLELETIDVSPFELINDVGAIFSKQAHDKGLRFNIEIEPPIPATIKSDLPRLRAILINLCGNAIKFTQEGGVTLHVNCAAHAEQIHFSVIDTGIGMTTEQQAKAFEMFHQADASTTRRFGGSGLGLYLSRKFAELLGGTVTVTSVPGQGSRFTASISTGALENVAWIENSQQVAQNMHVEISTSLPTRVKGHVLLVEDTPVNQDLISMYLRRAGAHVSVAANGEQGVEMAMANDFDLIFMDMQMPVMDGVSATRFLRSVGFGRPIIGLTANVREQDRQACLEAGCNEFMTKPINRERFFQLLVHYLQPAPEKLDTSALTANIDKPDPEFMELVKRFIAELPDAVQETRERFEARDWEGMRAIVHRLKGSGGGFGFPKLTELSGQLEFQIASRNRAQVMAHLVELENLCQRILAGAKQPDSAK